MAVAVYAGFTILQLRGLEEIQSRTIDRNRMDSLLLLRIQNNLNAIALAMRDMVDSTEPYGLTAWQGPFKRIRTDLADTHVIVRFEDSGGGMSAENLSHVFEPYFTTKASGSGLGLLIVRRIVREHGGELSIESSEGRGVTVTIRLPFIDKRIRMLEAGEARDQLQDGA